MPHKNFSLFRTNFLNNRFLNSLLEYFFFFKHYPKMKTYLRVIKKHTQNKLTSYKCGYIVQKVQFSHLKWNGDQCTLGWIIHHCTNTFPLST